MVANSSIVKLNYMMLAVLGSSLLLGIAVSSSHLAYDLNRVVLLFFLTFFPALYFFSARGFALVGFKRVWFGFSVFVISAATSDFLSESSEYQFVNFSLYFLFFLFISLSMVFLFGGKIIYSAIRFCVFSVILLSIIIVFIFISLFLEEGLGQLDDAVLNAGFVNINYFGHLLTLGIPLHVFVLSEMIRERRRIFSLFVFFVLVSSWWIAVQLSIRGTLYSIIISFVVLSFVFGKRGVCFSLLGVVACLVAIFISLVTEAWLFIYDSDVYGALSNVDSSGRDILWKEAIAMSGSNFPFGMGSESWLTHSSITDALKSEHRFGHPHNMVLLWAAEFGWLSTFGLFLLVWAAIDKIRCYRSTLEKQELSDDLGLGLISSSVAGAVHAGVSGVFLVPTSMLFSAVVFFMTFGYLNSFSSRRFEVKIKRYLIVPLFLGFFVVFVGWLVPELSSYHLAMSLDKDRQVSDHRVNFSPRFWVHGYASDTSGSYQIQTVEDRKVSSEGSAKDE